MDLLKLGVQSRSACYDNIHLHVCEYYTTGVNKLRYSTKEYQISAYYEIMEMSVFYCHKFIAKISRRNIF